MAVPEQIPVVNYVADGVVKKFDVPFEYDQQPDLHVYVDGVEPTIDKYYFDGNAFNFYIAPTVGQDVKIKRITPKERDTDYNLHTNTVRPKALNTDFDRLWYVLQEVFSDVGGLSQAVQDEIIARIQGDEDLLNQLTAEISARMLGDEAVTEDLKNYVNQVVGAIIGDPSFAGIDAKNVNDASGETQQQVNYNGGSKWHSRVGGYKLNERVVLTNGDIVKSTIDGNANDPNVDMTGWVLSENSITVESIADLLAIQNPEHGQVVFVHHYDLDQGILDGGGTFVYQNTNQLINDGGYIFNGWTRKLERPVFTPEMFGAKGDLSKDDAPNIRACINSARTNKIKCIQFYNKYLIDSPRITGQETLLEIIPDCSFLGFGDTEFVVGDNIPDKFHILAAVNYIITTSSVGNVLIDGVKFRGLSEASNMSSYASNIAIHTFGLNNVCIQRCTFDDLDLANVIASGIRYDGVDYGSKVTIQNNKILSVVAENPINIDHSSIYMEAPDSLILNNLFKSKTLQCRKVACGVEAHAKNIQTVGNQLYGYSRFGWLAALPIDVVNSNFIDNIAHVSNHLIILTSASDARVSKCAIMGNIVRCEHATSEVDFVTHQGLIVTSGLLDPLGWLESNEIIVEGNTLNIAYSVNPNFATIANIEHDTFVRFSNNIIYGAVAGVNLFKFDSCCFTGNKIYNHITSTSLNKDFFIQINGSGLNSADISSNEYKFNASTKPNYLIGFPNMTGDSVVSTSILGNKYLSNQKPQADVYFQSSLNMGGNANTLDINVFNVTVNIPALTSGQEHTWTQALPNNFNNCIVDLGVIAESKFYPLVSRAVATDSSLSVRVKGLVTGSAFNVASPVVNIKTL